MGEKDAKNCFSNADLIMMQMTKSKQTECKATITSTLIRSKVGTLHMLLNFSNLASSPNRHCGVFQVSAIYNVVFN